MKTRLIPHTLRFKRPAGTSRGVYHDHKVWYVVVSDNAGGGNGERWGIGECAPLPDLSCDYSEDYEERLQYFCRQLEKEGTLDKEALRPYPSILFGLETAMRHLQCGSYNLYDTPFSRGEEGIAINGLIWMGDYSYMLAQIEEKLAQGFRCIKLKIGAIDFEQELALLHYIRSHFSADRLTLRADANGAFAPDDAPDKLQRLSQLNLHSIEQPIRAGNPQQMARLCATTPLPIALDEELIGVNDPQQKEELLDTIRPQYIILKPTLHGGISGAGEWIKLAEEKNIGWWVTSALESNIGLNAIAQWCATYGNPLPQGLGTGALYTNNVEMPLEVRGDCLWYAPDGETFLPKMT
ncbi:o-succinylbenzoate synthase [Dysgonomonas sp. 511]|uniref:o-succinylbenzoate synthase n=1 Tax=Dysgonomonas sp. 511 TaxID=2302930 RepID=UPI0013D4D29E|nr:o-succinylbenzoate synthase [Dysgonomonas sp. 511]NDV79751.1 o-succinylbenzoate synthase [Dysgonomonas sp. 511]